MIMITIQDHHSESRDKAANDRTIGYRGNVERQLQSVDKNVHGELTKGPQKEDVEEMNISVSLPD